MPKLLLILTSTIKISYHFHPHKLSHTKFGNMSPAPHPLQMLSVQETEAARDIEFRQVDLKEPCKKDLVQFLQIEHDGQLSETTSRPLRVAKCHYDIIAADRTIQYHESLVDLKEGKIVENTAVGKEFSPSLTL
jgi:primary-amine oxidase